MEADSLSAISANLGTVTAGEITLKWSRESSTDPWTGKTFIGTSNKTGYPTISYEVYQPRSNRTTSVVYGPLGISLASNSGGVNGEITIENIVHLPKLLADYAARIPWTLVEEGRMNVRANSSTWLKIRAVPGFSTANKYVAMLNCFETPVIGSVRSDGWLIGWGNLVTAGSTYKVDYAVFKLY